MAKKKTTPKIPKADSPTPELPETPKTKLDIPKQDTKTAAPKADPEEIKVEAPQDATATSVDPQDGQLNVEQAIAYAMTTPNPRQTVNRLKAQRKLTEVTLTLKKLEELGH